MIEYNLPEFLTKMNITRDEYIKWLNNKARTHYNRDKKYFGKKFKPTIKPKNYKVAIHNAVTKSEGKCFYTGELLRWDLINKFGKESYNKKEFDMLPTLEHIDRSKFNLVFAIASWKVNDSKNDLSVDDFISLCKKIVHNEEEIKNKASKVKNKDGILWSYVER